MDPQSDLLRVTIDSAQDWERIKANYASAALAVLDEQLVGTSSKVRKDVLAKHLDQVRMYSAQLHASNL